MTLRRLLTLLALVALAVSPFGRMAAAEAMAVPEHRMTAAAGHCDEQPAPEDRTHPAGIDCLVACAAMAAAAEVAVPAAHVVAAEPQATTLPDFIGLHPEAEPPPPRLS